MAARNEFLRMRYDRAIATAWKLRQVWESESHSRPEGSAAIQRALEDYNDAAERLTEAWNERTSRSSP